MKDHLAARSTVRIILTKEKMPCAETLASWHETRLAHLNAADCVSRFLLFLALYVWWPENTL